LENIESNVFQKKVNIEFRHLYVRNYWLITNMFRNNLILVLTVLTVKTVKTVFTVLIRGMFVKTVLSVVKTVAVITQQF